MGEQAFVSLATNDTYGTASLVLGDSLRTVNTSKTLALLVTKDVTPQLRDQLNQIWDFVIDIEELPIEKSQFEIPLTKLKLWLLIQFKKCVFLSADTLVLKNVDELFDREQLSAAPDSCWPDCFNSGVFVFMPSKETYDDLIKFADEQGHFDGGEQELLNMFFKDWSKNISFHLPYVYNVVPSTSYTYAPAYNYFGKDVKVVHFRGASKPWEHHYDYQNSRVASPPTSQGRTNHQAFIQEWWNRYHKLQQNVVHDGTAALQTTQDFQLQKQESKEDMPNQEQKNAWERGDIDFMRKDRFCIIQNYLNNVIDGTEVAEYCEEDYQIEENFVEYDRNDVQHEEQAYCQDVPESNAGTGSPNAFKLEINYETINYSNDERESAWADGKQGFGDEENQIKVEEEHEATDFVLDSDRAAQLRWESGIIDFTGEDKFEYIGEYLNSLLSGMETVLDNSREYTPVPTIENGMERLQVNGRISPILSIADSAYSETAFHKLDIASKATQTSVICVEAAVQTDLELYCCNQYEEFIKMYLTYVDKRGATNDVIDIKPHAPYGTKAARKAAKERAAERMREKEMERQKAVTAQANVFSFSRQIKTLQYALSSVKCMEDGWTIRPPTPLIEEPVTNDDDFAIEVNTTLLQRTNQLYQRFYENGNRFLVIFADGTGCCYYPSGNVAVLIISHELGKYTYVLQTDTDDYDTDDTGVLGVFEPNGNGTCYYKDGSLRLVLTQHNGVHIDKHGSYRKKWNWHFIRGHVHTPPFQPICFALNQQLSCRVMEQDNIVVTFASGQRAVRFNVGAKLKAIKHTIPPLAKKDEHADFMESTRKKVQSIYDKVQLTMRFPNSPKLKTLVSNTQQKERKNTTAGTSSKVHLPKLKEKPSVVVN